LPDEARELLAEVARKLNLSQIQLDHAIWNYQRGRKILGRKIWKK
jgi:exonuclease VII small subunit